jgi:uncharacterized protein involved in exopolysaccharide biosynthesis
MRTALGSAICCPATTKTCIPYGRASVQDRCDGMNNRELQVYLRPILRWWWLILLAALLAGASAFVFVRLRPPVYIASGTVMVGTAIQERNPDSQQLSLTQGLAQTYVKIAQRPSIRDATREALGMDWLPEYAVRIVPDSQLIEINVTDVDAQRAYAVATELINQLILLSPGGQERQQREVFHSGAIAEARTRDARHRGRNCAQASRVVNYVERASDWPGRDADHGVGGEAIYAAGDLCWVACKHRSGLGEYDQCAGSTGRTPTAGE